MRLTKLISLSLALALSGCVSSGSGRVTGPPGTVEFTRITREAPSVSHNTGLLAPTRMLISDAATLADVWGRAYGGIQPAPELPSVDFTSERVLLAALGERSSGGYGIEFTRLAIEGGELVAEVRSTSPGKFCAVSTALTQPVDIVKFPRTDATVRFVESKAIADCSR